MIMKFDKKIFPAEAVLHACDLFGEQASFDIQQNKASVIVKVLPKRGGSNNGLGKLVRDYKNELLHQALRLKVAKDNRKIREYIIEHALYAALPRRSEQERRPPVEEIKEEEIDKELEAILKEVEAEDYKADPLGIAVPWEEKHGKSEAGHEGEANPSKEPPAPAPAAKPSDGC